MINGVLSGFDSIDPDRDKASHQQYMQDMGSAQKAFQKEDRGADEPMINTKSRRGGIASRELIGKEGKSKSDLMDYYQPLKSLAFILAAFVLSACGGGGGGDIASITIADASITEGNSGNTNLSFTVTLSDTAPGPVNVDYTTSDGTAKIGDSDYIGVLTRDTLTIKAGFTTGNIIIPITGDGNMEEDENFTLTLSNPANAFLGTAYVATGTILNNDSDSAVVKLLNDTGITHCSNHHNNILDCEAVDATTTEDVIDVNERVPAGQDALYGRDVDYNDDSDGGGGFLGPDKAA